MGNKRLRKDTQSHERGPAFLGGNRQQSRYRLGAAPGPTPSLCQELRHLTR